MTFSKLLKEALKLVRSHPYIWLLALIAIVVDIWAVSTYDPNSVELSLNLFILLIAFIAETGLLYALLQHSRDEDSSLVDAFMTAVTSPGTVAAKAVVLVIPALTLVIGMIFGSILFTMVSNTPVLVVVGIIFLFLYSVLQIWTPFASSGIMVQNYSMAEATSHAIRIINANKKILIQLALLFIIVDLVLIGGLYLVGGISYESAFIYTVTEEAAQLNLDFATGGPGVPGEYFSYTRPVNGLLVAMFKARGIDLLSIPTFFISSKVFRIATVFASMLLIPLRLSVLAVTYNQIAEPTPELNPEVRDFWRKKRPEPA